MFVVRGQSCRHGVRSGDHGIGHGGVAEVNSAIACGEVGNVGVLAPR
jgi:hypothetical protein